MAVDTAPTGFTTAERRPRVRIAPLRFPTLPATLLVQLAGGASALAGVYLTFGTGVTMIVGGVATTLLGMLREAGKI